MAPPTVRSGVSAGDARNPSYRPERSSRSSRHDPKPTSEMQTRVKYNNTLPDIPFDPKFIAYPFDPMRFVEYKATSLEKNYRFELLAEPDLGVNIDLINPETYAVPPEVEAEGGYVLDPEDERLLEEEEKTGTETKRSKQHSKIVPWLRKPEYIGREFVKYGRAMEHTETKVGYNVRKKMNADTFYKDRESQIETIQKSFEAVKTPCVQHYSKPGVHAVQELNVFPDFDLWKIACAQVMFDSDPVPTSSKSKDAQSSVTQALIRGMMDESGEQFVAYFLPTEDNLEKRAEDTEKAVEYDPEKRYDYNLAREYNWNVKNKASKGYEENYFLVFRPDGVYYNELETRVRLNKRRHKDGGTHVNNSRLIVQHRTLNEQELNAQEIRLLQLQPESELAEEVIEEEEATELQDANEAGEAGDSDNEGNADQEPAASKEDAKDSDKGSSDASDDEDADTAAVGKPVNGVVDNVDNVDDDDEDVDNASEKSGGSSAAGSAAGSKRSASSEAEADSDDDDEDTPARRPAAKKQRMSSKAVVSDSEESD